MVASSLLNKANAELFEDYLDVEFLTSILSDVSLSTLAEVGSHLSEQ